MTVLNKLASQLERKDEQPNIDLAHELVNEQNFNGIQEIIENLSSKDKNIKHDCIKVAYEIGKVKPTYISEYALTFVQLLKSTNNRMVWGAMQALSSIANITADLLMEHLHEIQVTIKIGSVITIDKGIITLAQLASVSKENNEKIMPFLLEHLKDCRTKEVPQHAESTLIAINAENKEAFLEVLRTREPYMTAPQRKRIEKIYKQLNV